MIDDDIRRCLAETRNYLATAIEFSTLAAVYRLQVSPKGAVESLKTVCTNSLKGYQETLDRQLTEGDPPKVVYSSILKIRVDLEILIALQAKILSQQFQVPLSSLEEPIRNRIKGIDVDWDDVLKSS